MNRTVITYAVLLVIALVGAYLSWTIDSDESDATGAMVADIADDALKKVIYEKGEERVVLEVREDDLGTYVWAHSRTEKRTRPSHPHGMGKQDEKPKDEAEIVEASFKAGNVGDDAIDDLTPFRALRKMENVDDEKLEQFGLKDPQASLKLVTDSGERVYDVGESGYGHRNVYVRDRNSGEIFLVRGGIINPLKNAPILKERELYDYERAEIEKIDVRSADQAHRLHHHNRDDRSAAYWSLDDGEGKNETAETWLDKFFRLRARDYVSKDDEPKTTERTVMLVVHPTDGKSVKVEVLRGTSGDGKPKWYAKSDFTRGLVEVPANVASDLAQDVATLSGDEPDAEDRSAEE